MATATAVKQVVISRLDVLSPLKERNFALLMAGRCSSNMGRSMRVFARAWLVLELTGSPFLLGLVTSSLSWPMLVVPFLGGVLADRMDRRKLLLYTEFALAALWTVISIIITTGLIKWWHLMISGVLSGIVQGIGRPGHEAMLGNVLTDKEKLPKAVAIDAATHHWPNDAGLLVATIFFGVLGVKGVFWITAIGQTITGITLLLMTWEKNEMVAARQSMRSNLVEGIRHIRGESILLGLVLLAAMSSLFAGSYGFMLPVISRDLGMGAQGLGMLMIANTTGVSIGAAVVMGLADFRHRGALLMIAAIGYTFFILSFSRSEIFFLSLGLIFGMGMFNTLSRTMMQMLMQLLSPDHLRGRVMSLRVTMMGLSWIGVLWMGALAEFIGVLNTILIGGSLYGLVAFGLFARWSSLRNFK